MDGWGALKMLMNRQQADKWRKADFRNKLKTNKESYIGIKKKNEYNFPELTKTELEILKEEIRHKAKREKFNNTILFIISVTVTTVIIFMLVY